MPCRKDRQDRRAAKLSALDLELSYGALLLCFFHSRSQFINHAYSRVHKLVLFEKDSLRNCRRHGQVN